MIKTLRVTSVAAVILAGVVLASVLGFLRPASFLPLRVGPGSDKQTDNILKGPSAVERFKTQYGSKVPNSEDTTPPLIKQAELLAKIINPPEPSNTGVKLPGNLSPKPKPGGIKPPVVSSKFALLCTCCSSNPKASYAYIRLPDNTSQWVGVGDQIGHVTIKEIRKESVVCWDGKSESETPIEAIPETSSLLETSKGANGVPGPKAEDSDARPGTTEGTPQPGVAGAAKPGDLTKPASSAAKSPGGTTQSPIGVDKSANNAAKSIAGAAKSSSASSQPSAAATPAPSMQITKQEQEKLSRLGDRLKNDAGMDALGRTETANRLISEYRSSQNLPPAVRELGDSAQTDPGPEPLKKPPSDEDRRKYYSGRLTPPRAAKQQ